MVLLVTYLEIEEGKLITINFNYYTYLLLYSGYGTSSWGSGGGGWSSGSSGWSSSGSSSSRSSGSSSRSTSGYGGTSRR